MVEQPAENVVGPPAVVGGNAADHGPVSGPVPEPHSSVPLLPLAGREDWKSFRHSLGPNDSIEVFISPEGHWYKRCGKGDVPELRVPSKTKGLPMSYLVCIDHWRDTSGGAQEPST